MPNHRINTTVFQSGLVFLGLLLTPLALAVPKDKSATQLDHDAMQSDYVGTRFQKAEQKLKKAIAQCGAAACSSEVVGRLHRDLATVYIAGMSQGPKGKVELKRALQANPDLQLDNDFATTELRKAFIELGGHASRAAEEEKKTSAEPASDAAECEAGSAGCRAAAEPPAAGRSAVAKNWLSLHFEQDALIFPGQNNVCARANLAGSRDAPEYACFQRGAQFGYSPGQDIQAGPGNRVSGGVGRATSRVLVGFDRLLGANVSLGLRLGVAFAGGPARRPNNVKFFPFHAELRANYWFGAEPFASKAIRPYVSLSGGLAEIDGRVQVEYYDAQGRLTSLDAWRKTGKGFAGLGLGLMIPLGNSGIVPEIRALQLFGNSGTAVDVSLGYALGF